VRSSHSLHHGGRGGRWPGGGAWWLCNDSSSSVLYLSGDRGFRVDLPPGMRTPVQQWHAKVRLQGVTDSYMLRLRLPNRTGLRGCQRRGRKPVLAARGPPWAAGGGCCPG